MCMLRIIIIYISNKIAIIFKYIKEQMKKFD